MQNSLIQSHFVLEHVTRHCQKQNTLDLIIFSFDFLPVYGYFKVVLILVVFCCSDFFSFLYHYYDY